MQNLYKYSLFNMLREAQKNKHLIKAYIKGDTYEGFHGCWRSRTILGVSVPLFTTLLVLMTILWVWALVVTIVWWNQLEDWAKIIAILGLVFPSIGPIITILAVYISKFS